AVALGGPYDEAPPAAADVEEALARREAQLAAHEVELVLLRLVEVAVGSAVVGARVDHPLIEEERVEVVRDVVVEADGAAVRAFGPPASHGSPHPEGALEDETAAEPGARTGEPREGDDDGLRKVPRQAREPVLRTAESPGHTLRVARGPAVEDRLGGEEPAPDGGADAFARDVAGEAGGVAHEHEPLASEPAREAPAHAIRERASHRAAVAARADHERRREPLRAGLDHDGRARLVHRAHADALAHLRARTSGSTEQERVELRTHDPVAHRLVPAGLVLATVDRDGDRGEGMDRARIGVGRELEIGERPPRHPAGAELDARKGGGVEDEHPEPRAREPPGDGAAARPTADHEDVVRRHGRISDASSASRVPSGSRSASSRLAAAATEKMSPSMSASPAMN